MNTKHYILMLMATVFLAGCAFDDPQDNWSKPLFHSDSELVPVTFTMSSQHKIDLTRAETSIITFNQGEKVKVFVMPCDKTSYTGYEYTTDATAQSVGLVPVSSQPYFPAGEGTTIDAYAYYPATASIGSGTPFSVADIQISDEAYKGSDLMYAPIRTITKDVSDGKNNFKMNHQMAQLRIAVNPATETATAINITEIQVVAKKSIIFNPENTTVATTTGDPGTIIARYGAGEAYVLIPPQLISDVLIKVITGGGTDSEIATFGFTAEGSFLAGSTYGVDITLTADQLGMTTAIANWNGMGSVVIAPSGDLVITPISAQKYNNGEAIEPTLEVKKAGVPLTKNVDYTVTYLNNRDAGTAYVVVTGKIGTEYEGCVGVIPFKITSAKGKILYDGQAFSSEIKTYGDDKFIKPLTNIEDTAMIAPPNADGMVTYTSSDESVATVDPATGEVTLVKPGTTIITATVTDGANYHYAVKTASYGLTVKEGTANISFAVENPSITWSETATENNYSQSVTHTAVDYAIIPESTAPVTYSIIGNTNTCGATIDGNTVSFTKKGKVTILATVNDNDYYKYATKTASYTLTVNPHECKLTLSAKSGSVDFGDTGTFTINEHHHGGAISVASSDEEVATAVYNENDHKVTITTHQTGKAKITVTCAATDYYAEASAEYDLTVVKATAGVTAPTGKELTYNGDPQELLTAGSSTGGTMKYRYKAPNSDWSAWSTSVPKGTNAGTYMLQYMVEGDSNFDPIEATDVNDAVIAKYDPTGEWSDQTATIGCGGTFTRTYTITGVKGEVLSTTYQSSLTNIATVSPLGGVTAINKGTTRITASYAATSNYNAKSAYYDLTVTMGTPTVTAPTANNRTYDRTARPLLNAGTTSGGTMEYSSDGETWSTTIPSATDANTYTVYYRVFGNTNYSGVDKQAVTVTISPKTVTSPIIALSQNSYTYNGSAKTPTVSSVKYKDGNTDVTIPSSEYTVTYSNNTNASTTNNPAVVTINDKDGGNYDVSGNQTFTINKAAGYVNLSALKGILKKSSSTTFTVTGHHGGGLTLTQASGSSSATASLSGTTATVTSKTTLGKATFTVKSAATDNYNEASATYEMYVETALSEVNSTSYVGYCISTSGFVFSSATNCTNAGQTPIAMIAYYGSGADSYSSSYKGIALALKDLNDINSYTASICPNANGACGMSRATDLATALSLKNGIQSTANYLANKNGHNHTNGKVEGRWTVAYNLVQWRKNYPHPSGTSDWFLPTLGQYNIMYKAMQKKAGKTQYNFTMTSNSGMMSNVWQSYLTNAGGTTFRNGCTITSTESGNGSMWCNHNTSGCAGIGESKLGTWYCRFVFAF